MKKIYLILIVVILGNNAFGQTFANAGMEAWRTDSAGGISGDTTVAIYAPVSWYGFDSTVVSLGETFGHLIGAGNAWTDQVFRDSVIKHSGSYSAELITLPQDVLGNIASTLSNAQPIINVPELEATMSLAASTSFSGGTPITGRIATVSAWVQYSIDSALASGPDTASLTVLVYSNVGGIDSVVGSDTVYISPTSGWVEITAHVKYTDSVNGADTIRVLFSSSGATAQDSSTLHVDDVSMVYAPLGVNNVNMAGNIKVYPNPAADVLYIAGATQGELFKLFDINGREVASTQLKGQSAIDISNLAEGLYLYSILDKENNVMQRGKVSVVR